MHVVEINCEHGVFGNLNGDGEVNVQDVVILVHSFGPCPDGPDPCAADLNEEGVVDTNDLLIPLDFITLDNPGGPHVMATDS